MRITITFWPDDEDGATYKYDEEQDGNPVLWVLNLLDGWCIDEESVQVEVNGTLWRPTTR